MLFIPNHIMLFIPNLVTISNRRNKYLYQIVILYVLNYIKINSKMLGISLPKEILLKIDRDRGDIPTSKFLVKLIELAYNTNIIKP